MLYLTRGPQESIRIGDNITVMVIKVEGDRVTLGIQAPREVAVVRGERVVSYIKECQYSLDGEQL